MTYVVAGYMSMSAITVNYSAVMFICVCACVCKQKASPGVRVGVIDNPSEKPYDDNTVLYRAIWASLLTQKNKAAAEFVHKLLKEESSQLLQQGTKMKDLLMQVKRGLKNALFFSFQTTHILFGLYIYIFFYIRITTLNHIVTT